MEALAIVHPVTNMPLGILPRAQALKEGAWCRSTNIFVMNSQGQILCHQRSMQKERMPGVWSTHLGGHVAVGESYETNALKELEEESGIRVAAEQLIAWRTTRLDQARLWVREYVVLIDETVHELIPQPGEVDRFRWLSAEEIIQVAKDEAAKWCAGTHNFLIEYHCLRAALTAASAKSTPLSNFDLHTWHPVAAS
ncbi:MAG: NUDIX domain-containing protein [Patescibacteria group bacterium]